MMEKEKRRSNKRMALWESKHQWKQFTDRVFWMDNLGFLKGVSTGGYWKHYAKYTTEIPQG